MDRPADMALPDPVVGDPTFADRLGRPVQPAEVTTAGLLRAAAPQLADPSSAGPLVPLYLRLPYRPIAGQMLHVAERPLES